MRLADRSGDTSITAASLATPGPRSTEPKHRRLAVVAVAVVVILIGATIAVILAVRGNDSDDGSGHTVRLSGEWSVTGIEAASQHIAVPSRLRAKFLFDTAARHVSGFDGESTYDCRYVRSGDALSLSHFVVWPNVPGGRDQARDAVIHAFEQAFTSTSPGPLVMSVSSDATGGISIRLGDTTFAAAEPR